MKRIRHHIVIATAMMAILLLAGCATHQEATTLPQINRNAPPVSRGM